jgi:hypothetical protein
VSETGINRIIREQFSNSDDWSRSASGGIRHAFRLRLNAMGDSDDVNHARHVSRTRLLKYDTGRINPSASFPQLQMRIREIPQTL